VHFSLVRAAMLTFR